ncbi:MAG TPA: TetR/AcrR family transcriptional regulator [Gemmatimonadaceae bacterium]|nr:TetR/AcrR family transcriptional regulator [Gemmatimonadaceae bacterium]
MKPYDPLPHDGRADKILGAALAAFAESGFSDTRLGDIAHRAGLSMSTLLLYFPTKEEIFREVVRSALLDNLNHGSEIVPMGGATVTDAVRVFARNYWSKMEQPEMVAILRLAIGELPRFPELAVFHATETLERFAHALERIIEEGILSGEVKQIDAKATARMILATVAAHALWFAHPEIYGGITGADRERAATATIDTLVKSLTPG